MAIQSFFSIPCSRLLNNFLYSKTKFNDINKSILSLHQILITGEFKFPTLNLNLTETSEIVNIIYEKTFDKLISNNNGNITGYDTAKIYEQSNSQIDLYLNDLPTNYKNLVLQLQNIYEISNKNLDHYRLLLYTLNSLNDVYNINSNLDVFEDFNNLFKFLYFKQSLSENIKIKNEDSLSVIPTLLAIEIFKRIYTYANNTVNNGVSNLYLIGSNTFVKPEYLRSSLAKYIDINYKDISKDISTYIVNNILFFGNNISKDVFNTLQITTEELLVNTKDIANFGSTQDQNKMSGLINTLPTSYNCVDYIYRITKESFDNCCHTSFINGMQKSDSFILNFNLYSIMNDDDADKITQQYEQVFFNNIIKYINKNIGDIKQLLLIPIKFTNKPIYYLNTFSIIFSRFLLNYIQTTQCVTYTDLKDIFDRIIQPEEIKRINKENDSLINNIKKYVYYHPLEITIDDIRLPFFITMQEYITTVCDCDEFKEFIMKKYIPKIDSEMKLQYKINIDWYEYVDNIIYLFKLKFCKDLLNGLTSDFNKAPNFPFNDFYNSCCKILQQTLKDENNEILKNNKLTETEILNSFNIEFRAENKWYYIFNNFFKSAIVSSFVMNYLHDNYSL